MSPLESSSLLRPERAILAALLSEMRVSAGLTQAQAAEAIGIAPADFSEVETGARSLELLIIRDLVKAYGVNWLDFVGLLEERLAAAAKPVAPLIRRGRLRSGQ